MDAKQEVIADLLKEYQAHKRIMEKLVIQLEALGVEPETETASTLVGGVRIARDRKEHLALIIAEKKRREALTAN